MTDTQKAADEELRDLLDAMFSAYEAGPDCYEDPDEQAGYVGKAVKLDDATFHRIADILNRRRPRVAHNAELCGSPERSVGESERAPG